MPSYQPNDKWARKAKDEDFRARSVYKLREIDGRFHLLKKGMAVLDIGAAPGSWLQYVASVVGEKGKAVGLDLQDIKPIHSNVLTYVCDITDGQLVEDALHQSGTAQFDLVLSDIAPSTSGIKDVDQWRSVELSECVLAIARKYLRKGGNCVMKILRGADFDDFYKEVRTHFSTVKIATAKASRSGSREVYVVGIRKK